MIDTASWHVVKCPDGSSSPSLDGSTAAFKQEHPLRSDGNFGTFGAKLKIFQEADAPNQKAAVRYINVYRFNTDELLASFWPDRRGGFIDAISGKFYAPVQGEVEIKK